MATAICPRCGRPFTPGPSTRSASEDQDGSTLAGFPGVTQPPEAASALAGATPFDAELGTDSGPVEYGTDGERLCPSCQAESREVSAK